MRLEPADLGGSEIGVLVRNHMGHRADHMASAHDIVASKLLRLTPTEATQDMLRGTKNEGIHASWFYEKYSTSRDVEAFEQLKRAEGVRPWMRYSPDDIVCLESSVPNPYLGGAKLVRYLIDYKAPRRVEAEAEVSFQYQCQLTQGAMICKKNGIHLDGLMLSQFDWAGYQLKDDMVPYDQDLAKLIIEAGDNYWNNYVLKGEVPPYITTPRFEGESGLQEKLAEAGTMIARLTAMSKALVEALTPIKDELKEILSQYRLAGTKLTLGDLSVTSVRMLDHGSVIQHIQETTADGSTADLMSSLSKKSSSKSYDQELMAKALESMGVDLTPFRKIALDDSKVFEYLLANGQDPERFVAEELRMSPSKALVEQAKEAVKEAYPGLQELLANGLLDGSEARNCERNTA